LAAGKHPDEPVDEHPDAVTAEASRPTENPDALDYLFRARVAGWKPPSRAKYAEQIGLLERGLVFDPLSIEARSFLAIALTSRAISGMADAAAADIASAEGLARQVLAASPGNPLVHFAKAQVLRAQSRFDEAIPEYEAALAGNRNFVGALHPLAQCKLFVGLIEETIPLEEQAIRLSPCNPELFGVWYSQIGLVHLLQGEFGGSALGLAFEGIRSGEVRVTVGALRHGAARLFEPLKQGADFRHTPITGGRQTG
jgi:tetratricopeptide (TPR) repeat protein